MPTVAKFEKFVASLDENLTPSEATVDNAIDVIRTSLREYVESRNLQTLVIGLYGTLSSTVLAAMCQEKYTGVPLIGVIASSEHKPQAEWAAENFCTASCEYDMSPDISASIGDMIQLVEDAFASYIDSDNNTEANMQSSILHAIFSNLAYRTNGLLVGDKTWSDNFAVFKHPSVSADYFPLQAINKGFELPEFAKRLNIPDELFTSRCWPPFIGTTYKEADVIINGTIGNFDDNLTTQLRRFKNLETVRQTLFRFDLTDYDENACVLRFMVGLPTEYSY